MAEDLSFTFDTSFFEKGIKKVIKGMDAVRTTAGTMAKGISNGITSVAKKIGSLFLAFKGLKSLLNQMPEFGKAFGLAKDVFFKNLLWPLRQHVMPLLQKMLDWVRDNRATFVKWGAGIVNVFKTIVSFAKRVIDAGKQIFQSIHRVFQRIFGDSVKSWEEAWNLFTFKIAVAAEVMGIVVGELVKFLGQIVERFGPPLIKIFTDIIGFIIDMAQKHWPSFQDAIIKTGELILKWVEKWLPTFKDLLDDAIGYFLNLWTNDILPLADKFLQIIDDMFISSGVLKGAWELIKTLITGVVNTFSSFLDGFSTHSKAIGENITGILNNLKEMVTNWLNPNLEGNSLLTLAEKLGTLFSTVWNTITSIVNALTTGFKEATKEIMTPLTNIVDSFTSIWELIFGKGGTGKGLMSFFEGLGSFIGDAVMFVLEGIADTVKTIENAIKFIKGQETEADERTTGRKISEVLLGPIAGKGLANIIEKATGTGRYDTGEEVDDALITNDGKVIKFNPNDNILAFQGNAPGGTINVDMGGVHVSVTEGNARAAGEEFAGGIMEKLQTQYNTEFMRMGN